MKERSQFFAVFVYRRWRHMAGSPGVIDRKSWSMYSIGRRA